MLCTRHVTVKGEKCDNDAAGREHERRGEGGACHLAVRVGYIGIKEVRGFNHVATAAPKAQHFAHAAHGSLHVAFARVKLNAARHAKAAGKADVALPARASLPG